MFKKTKELVEQEWQSEKIIMNKVGLILKNTSGIMEDQENKT